MQPKNVDSDEQFFSARSHPVDDEHQYDDANTSEQRIDSSLVRACENDGESLEYYVKRFENVEEISEIDEKKNDLLVQIRRLIHECSEIKHELTDLKSHVQYKNVIDSKRKIWQNCYIKKMNYSTLIGICRKINVNCCSLETLSMAELQFLQEIAYAAGIRKKAKEKVFKDKSPDMETCVIRVDYLRSIVEEAKENTKFLKNKLNEIMNRRE